MTRCDRSKAGACRRAAKSSPAPGLKAVRRSIGCLALLCASAANGADAQRMAEDLFSRLCQSLLALQNTGAEIGGPPRGPIFCPSRNPVVHGYHTRGGEAVFPFALRSQRESDPEQKATFLKAAILAGDWLVDRRRPEGCWIETPHSWWGTTGHQLFCLAAAYRMVRDALGEERKVRWLDALRRACDFLVARVRAGTVPVSHLPTAACGLRLCAEIPELIPNPSWESHARSLLEGALSSQNSDGIFIEEEGAIDVGANLGQTIPLAGLYAALTRDEGIRRRVLTALEQHLVFVWPDGSIDSSWGSGIHKWMLWGTFGTYGPTPGFALLGRESPFMRDMAARHLAYVSHCFRSELAGHSPALLGYGPHADLHKHGKDVCIYPTVCTAVGLAIALAWGDLAGAASPLPEPAEPPILTFPSCKVAVVRARGIRATISWSSEVVPVVYPPRGGTITHLYMEDFGTVQCASPGLFVRPEVVHLPLQRDVLPLTPRIEIHDGDFWYASIFDRETEVELDEGDPFQLTVHGSLCDPSARPSGVSFRLKYRFGPHHVRKSLSLYGRARNQTVTVREPFLMDRAWSLGPPSVTAVRFETEQGNFQISLESPSSGAILEHAREDERFCFPLFPAAQAVPIQIRFADPDLAKARWIIERLPAEGKDAPSR